MAKAKILRTDVERGGDVKVLVTGVLVGSAAIRILFISEPDILKYLVVSYRRYYPKSQTLYFLDATKVDYSHKL